MRDSDNRTPHPTVKARRYDTAVQGELTNAKIVVYALAGYYGTDIKKRAEKLVAKKKGKTKAKELTNKTQDLVNALLDDLL